ncbi:MAG: radical SAM protein [Patescibacteria group bacterium]
MTETVCLIIPPSPFLLDERVFPFLGILKVASALERKGIPVDVLDLSGYENFAEIVRTYVQGSPAMQFGITATTPQLPAAVEIADTIRQARPKARIILGGPHATLTVAAHNYEMKKGVVGRAHRAFDRLKPYFDTLVAGDGEETIFLALAPDAPAVIDADGRKSPHKELFLTNERLNESAFPARHLIDLASYHYTIEGAPATSLIAQLGCPFVCGFCAGRLSPMLRHVRTRSTASIIEEMSLIYRTYGHTGFMFYDDELNVSPSMVELMEAIEALGNTFGVKWHLRGFIKAELFTEIQARVMYQAGFRQILVGFESGSPRILENIQKRATREDNTRCISFAQQAGLKVKALMSIGHPGESRETVEDTRDWLLAVRPSDFDVTVITPYPGSPYYDQAEEFDSNLHQWVYRCKSGDALYQQEIDYTVETDAYKGIPGHYVSHVWTDHLSAEELVSMRDKLESDCRRELGIPFNPSAAATLFEHSMGQTSLPRQILRHSLAEHAETPSA